MLTLSVSWEPNWLRSRHEWIRLAAEHLLLLSHPPLWMAIGQLLTIKSMMIGSPSMNLRSICYRRLSRLLKLNRET